MAVALYLLTFLCFTFPVRLAKDGISKKIRPHFQFRIFSTANAGRDGEAARNAQAIGATQAEILFGDVWRGRIDA